MGATLHHAFLVSSHDDQSILEARGKAASIFGEMLVGPLSFPQVNSVITFVVYPDGANEGGDLSRGRDQQRVEFIEWLRGRKGSLTWACVQYGGDGQLAWGETRVVASS